MGVLANVLKSPLPDFDGAACRGMDIDLFIASEDDRTQYRSEDAKRVCRSCPCMDVCREYAIADPRLIGVWGATTVKDRELIRYKRRREGDG